MLLAGDVGTTKTNLAVYRRESGVHVPILVMQRQSADYDPAPACERRHIWACDTSQPPARRSAKT